MSARFLALVTVLVGLSPGCIELAYLLNPGPSLPDDGSSGDGDGQDGLPDGNGDDPPPLRVALSVSNPTPQVNEQVFLKCAVTAGNAEGVIFSFQPSGGRLFVDQSAGVASFIVNETDVATSLTFTCAARNDLGETATSQAVIVTATQ